MTAREIRLHHYRRSVPVVISNGVNTDFFHPIETQKPKELKGLYVVTAVGRLAHEKRQDLLIKAVANEAGVDFRMSDIDALSRKVPCLCKVAPNTAKYHVQDVNRAGGIVSIMKELADGGLVDTSLVRVDGMTLAHQVG